MPASEPDQFRAAAASVELALQEIGALPVLPSEVEDILTISSRERHKWMKDGRLKSIGTRTVKLRGRAKAVTFHIFDPRDIEDALNRDLPTMWREDDVITTAENRRRAAGKAALRRVSKTSVADAAGNPEAGGNHTQLDGWEAFEADGLLR